MAYNVTSSTYRTTNSGDPKGSFTEPEHIYEEQPYYANERSVTKQSIGDDSRRSGGVC